jgi:aminoglycoside/choline kinase family phosphotransferase
MHKIIKTVGEVYKNSFGKEPLSIIPLPQSGSDRKYFRIESRENTMIAAYNPVPEENEAFIGFTHHFRSKGLPVPQIYAYFPEKHIYYLQDLGDVNLFTWYLPRLAKGFDNEADVLFRKILDRLLLFQSEGIKGLDLELCYPHKSFDRQSMMWDMNYFKYMFLKLIAAPFNEKRLEHDFERLAEWLLSAGQDFFLYRDFQSANIMIFEDEPWFIDYQGGRRGAPQYDLASFLFDAKIHLPEDVRKRYLDYHANIFGEATGMDVKKFKADYSGFTLIRLMQALGAFGFRGLYENKPTFTESIVPAVGLLESLIADAEKHVNLPELYSSIRSIRKTPKFTELAEFALRKKDT